MLSADRIAEIESRYQASTPGKWTAQVYDDGAYLEQEDRGEVPFGFTPDGEPDIDDATFCAEAHQDIPALLEERRELLRELEAMTAYRDSYVDRCNGAEALLREVANSRLGDGEGGYILVLLHPKAWDEIRKAAGDE